ncbi:hypothetical protein JB92DRAFT_2828312 [Gautieria morchelliformis]|nr:hypothetical protein JB92DRAFT_2828312 [Gautieria morchelliformis]
MSHSDTDAGMIDTGRPKYPIGRQVSFIHLQYSNDVLVGIIASSRQTIHGRGIIQITYDIQSSGMIFPSIPEESILQNPWPTQQCTKRTAMARRAHALSFSWYWYRRMQRQKRLYSAPF